MHKPLSQIWNLDTIFEGGSDSKSFEQFLTQLETDIAKLRSRLESLSSSGRMPNNESLSIVVDLVQAIFINLREADSYAACLSAQDQNDKKAVLTAGAIKSIQADLVSSLTLFDQLLTNIDDRDWASLMEQEVYRKTAFYLTERRMQAQDKLAPEQEALIGDLSVDGYHGWGELYNTTVGKVQVPFEENGEMSLLSAGRAANKLHHPNREIREKTFASWEKAWSEQADFCADALNHLGGFRLQVYKHRGWKSVLKEPLLLNRMSQKTLDAMWTAVISSKPIFVEFLQRKASMFGLDKLSWHDVDAPISSAVKEYSYDDAAELILEQFAQFSPKMAEFAAKAFEERWIEAQDRPGKRPGGFCTSFPRSEQTRIFMTYANTASNVSTLAHELGHAYHQHVMNDMPGLAQEYAMNVAETASTFAELIVSEAAVKQTTDPDARLALLEDKIQRSIAFFMNIHARFIFENQFYAERKQGLVSAERLNELMEAAQKNAYADSLSEYHPHFWASKLHFYITEVPYYNFPYTFGYLFSAGIYAIAVNEGTAFEDKYIALLRDTGSMTVEDLAMKHLQVDLREADFWEQAVGIAASDVTEFLRLTKQINS